MPLAYKNRFLEKVRQTDNCWEWAAAKDPNGYGRFWSEGQMRLAHRISFQLFSGMIPSNLDVLYNCNNPSCVKPAHLRLGTHQENMKDLHLAQTCKTQKIEWKEAQSLRAKNWTFREIGNYFGASPNAVSQGFKRHGY